MPATLTRNTDADPTQPTLYAKVDAGIVGVDAPNMRTCGANASKLDPTAARSYLRGRSVSSARSTVPRETPTSRPISRFECWPAENSWRIFAQSSILITFHSGRWSCFQTAILALFSVGVNTQHSSFTIYRYLRILFSALGAHALSRAVGGDNRQGRFGAYEEASRLSHCPLSARVRSEPQILTASHESLEWWPERTTRCHADV